MKARILIGLTGLGILALAGASRNSPNPDEALVRETILDYVEAFYNVQPERIDRSVDPSLAKLGFYRPKNDKEYKPGEAMTFAQLRALAERFNKSGKLPKEAPKEIVVFDVLDKTACAKLTAHWGIDFLQLAKVDGKWKIYQVIWQSAPA